LSSSSDTGHPAGTSASNEGPIPVGITLDNKYLVRQVLGKGSMGMVYLARDVALERDVAIKVLLPRYAADEKVAKRFRREAVAMASVRHDNVVQIFAFGDHEGHPYFVMEYIAGHTVANLLESANDRGEQLYLDVVLGILAQVCHGLQAVHSRRIVHRDVKPANMLIGPRFRVAITDFGLVEQIHSAGAARDLAGTPLYLAPELIRRDLIPEDQLHRCDIYALGISTFEMLTGEVPFDGEVIKDILRRHLQETPPLVSELRSDIPKAIAEVIARAMNKTPAERYGSCIEFLDALNEARAGDSTAPRSGNARILVVDDDPEIRTIYTTALKIGIPDAIITTAEDGMTAMEMVKASRPDLILLDMEMPRMNGLEVCASLTGDEMTAAIPLIVLSARTEENTRALLKSIGVRSVLRKPVELTHLVDLAKRYLKEAEKRS
jgi:eukaryotic-like serine/threonine-protein kinase